MFENLLALEIRKQKGTFFSLLFVIGLSLAVISIVAYLNSVAGFTEIISIAVSVLIFLEAITLPLFLGGWSGASLRKEPASSIEEVLP
jgi:uncharacterized oligopeptide transporter (OPT) family protein